jgi:ComF family protein
LGCAEAPKAFDALRAPFLYGGPLVELVHRMKFSAREDLAALAGAQLAKDLSCRALAVGAQLITAVPLGRSRKLRRGYNQSAIVAQTLAHHWELPYRPILRRTRDTVAQSTLAFAARRHNVHEAFVATGAVCGRVVLVDDVVTTGETLSAAAYALRQAGASEVVAIALARAPKLDDSSQ